MFHFFPSLRKTFGAALGVALLGCVALPTTAQTVGWAPYFGNTHFGFSTDNTTGGNNAPSAGRMADLDGDSDLDVVVAHSTPGTGFSVLRNLGSSYFGALTHYPSRNAAEDLVVGEFTGDSILDVVVTNTGLYGQDSTVALFRGLSNGLFTADSTFVTGEGPSGLAAADFNADGHLDLAVVCSGFNGQDSTVSILLNTGTGAFAAQLVLPVSPGVLKLAAGRMDADSLPDLVTVDRRGRVFVLRNLGQGAFQATAYPMATTAGRSGSGQCIALADMDGDQDLDVITSTSDNNGGLALIWQNTGAGVLDPAQTVLPFEAFTVGSWTLAVADLNNDNRLDLVSASSSGRSGDGYRVMLNQGNGVFSPPVVRPGGQRTLVVLAGEISGDSLVDILTLDSYSRELTVHPNRGNGQFPDQTLFTAGVPSLSGIIESADLDNDGDLDIVTSSNSRTAVSVGVAVLINLGNDTFAPGVQVATAGVQVKCRDLNGDTFADLLYIGGTGSTGYRFYTAFNNGNGTFAAPVMWNVGACAPEDIDAADMDGDSDLDVVVVNGCNSEIAVCANDGTGTFAQAVIMGVNSSPEPLALGDFNEDGRVDVAVGLDNEIAVLLADNTGTLLAPTNITINARPFDILAADVNDDGHLDLASCNYGSGGSAASDYSMGLRLGNGDGTFGPLTLLPAADSPDLANVSGIACGDIDNDNDLDLMVSNNATNDMSVYINNGVLGFSAALRAGLYYGARSPLFADFDNDGHCEMAALVSLPPGGFQSALVILQGTNSGFRTAGTGPVVLSAPTETALAAAPRLTTAPNPFGAVTTFSFALPRAGAATVTVYNVLGQVVARPFSGSLTAGTHTVAFPKGNLAAGTYHVRLVSGALTRTATVVVVD